MKKQKTKHLFDKNNHYEKILSENKELMIDDNEQSSSDYESNFKTKNAYSSAYSIYDSESIMKKKPLNNVFDSIQDLKRSEE